MEKEKCRTGVKEGYFSTATFKATPAVHLSLADAGGSKGKPGNAKKKNGGGTREKGYHKDSLDARNKPRQLEGFEPGFRKEPKGEHDARHLLPKVKRRVPRGREERLKVQEKNRPSWRNATGGRTPCPRKGPVRSGYGLTGDKKKVKKCPRGRKGAPTKSPRPVRKVML